MNRPKILVVSFSQSGQLHEIMTSLLAPLRESSEIEIVEAVLEPLPAFPFPWSAYEFLNVFPESYRAIACRLAAPKVDLGQDFALVVIAYQVWYLSPSIPVSSFLGSDTAKKLLNNRPVLTLVACRNMWYRAHQMVKEYLRAADAHLIGHITLADRAINVVSVITVVHWMLSGRKDSQWGVLPKPGISQQDIRRCSTFGSIIANGLAKPTIPDIQDSLKEAGACRVVPHLLLLENAASRAFSVWSGWILARGGRAAPGRRVLVCTFGFYLACGIAVLSPLAFIIFHLTYPFRRRAVERQVERVYRY